MAKLIIHIGTHKTGTTSVQKALALHRVPLKSLGLIYPPSNRYAAHHLLVPGWTPRGQTHRNYDAALQGLRALAGKYAATDATLLISSEEYSRASPGNPTMFQDIKSAVSGFDQVDVVCTLRDQVSYLQSIYLEICRKRKAPSWVAFLKKAIQDKTADGLFLDYGTLYDRLLPVFTADNITFLSFPKLAQHPAGLAAGFLAGLGLPGADAVADAPARNTTPDPLAAWIASFSSVPKIAPRAMIEHISNEICREFGAERPTTCFSRPEVQKLQQHFAPLNTAFAARVAKHQPGFEIPGTSIGLTHLHRGQLNSSVWLSLLKQSNAALMQKTQQWG